MLPTPMLAFGSSSAFAARLIVLAGIALVVGVALGVRQRSLAAASDPWRRRWLLWPQLGLVVAVTLLAYSGVFSSDRMPWLYLPGVDKTFHFLLFGGLALGMHFACRGRTLDLDWFRIPLAVLIPLSLALTEELLQAFSPHRSADPFDLLADLLGLLVFWRLALRLDARQAHPGSR